MRFRLILKKIVEAKEEMGKRMKASFFQLAQVRGQTQARTIACCDVARQRGGGMGVGLHAAAAGAAGCSSAGPERGSWRFLLQARYAAGELRHTVLDSVDQVRGREGGPGGVSQRIPLLLLLLLLQLAPCTARAPRPSPHRHTAVDAARPPSACARTQTTWRG